MYSRDEQKRIERLESQYDALSKAMASLIAIFEEENVLTNNHDRSLDQVLDRKRLIAFKEKKSNLIGKIKQQADQYYDELALQINFLKNIYYNGDILKQLLNDDQRNYLKENHSYEYRKITESCNEQSITYRDFFETINELFAPTVLLNLVNLKKQKTSNEMMLCQFLTLSICAGRLKFHMDQLFQDGAEQDASGLAEDLPNICTAINEERNGRKPYIPQGSKKSVSDYLFKYRKPLLIVGGIVAVGGVIAAGIFTGGFAWLGVGIAGGIGMGAVGTGAATGIGLGTVFGGIPIARYLVKKVTGTVFSAARAIVSVPFYRKKSQNVGGEVDSVLNYLNEIYDNLKQGRDGIPKIQLNLSTIAAHIQDLEERFNKTLVANKTPLTEIETNWKEAISSLTKIKEWITGFNTQIGLEAFTLDESSFKKNLVNIRQLLENEKHAYDIYLTIETLKSSRLILNEKDLMKLKKVYQCFYDQIARREIQFVEITGKKIENIEKKDNYVTPEEKWEGAILLLAQRKSEIKKIIPNKTGDDHSFNKNCQLIELALENERIAYQHYLKSKQPQPSTSAFVLNHPRLQGESKAVDKDVQNLMRKTNNRTIPDTIPEETKQQLLAEEEQPVSDQEFSRAVMSRSL